MKEGAELTNSGYTNNTDSPFSLYKTSLNIIGWGAFFSSDYSTRDNRFTLSTGIRVDGNNYNRGMKQLWKQLSPRLSASYKLSEQWILNGSAGLYHQLPPYTALGFKQDGALVRLASARPYHDFRRRLL